MKVEFWQTRGSSSVISNCEAEIEDCCFQKCWHFYDSSTKDLADKRRCLFSRILSESNNEVIDSAALGPH